MTYLCSDGTASSGMTHWTLGIQYETTALTSGTRVHAQLYLTMKYEWQFTLGSDKIYLEINGTKYYCGFSVNKGSSTETYILKDVIVDIAHTAAKSISLSGHLDASSITWWNAGKKVGTYDTSGTLSFPARTSKCSAPSNIKIDGYSKNVIVEPNTGSFKLTWTAGSGGTNNTFAKYYVQWKIGSADWSSLTSNASIYNPTGTSVTVSVPNSTRGTEISFRIRTEGSAGSSFYSDFSESSYKLILNKIPPTPTITPNRSIVPSTGGSVNFSVTVGKDQEGLSTKVFYNTSNTTTGATEIIGTSITKNITTNTTYYFWTRDKLTNGSWGSYSSSVSKTITVNIKPELLYFYPSTEFFYSSTYTASNSDNSKTASYLKQANLKIKSNKAVTLTLYSVYENLTVDSSNEKHLLLDTSTTTEHASKQLFQKALSANTDTLLTFLPANNNPVISVKQSYTLYAYITDGIEESKCYLGTSTQTENPTLITNYSLAQFYFIPPLPEIINVYNQEQTLEHSGNIQGTTTSTKTYFYQDLSAKLIKDTGCKCSIELYDSNDTLLSVLSSTNNENNLFTFYQLTAGEIYHVKITAQSFITQESKNKTFNNLAQVRIFNPTNIVCGRTITNTTNNFKSTVFKPFSDNAIVPFTMSDPNYSSQDYCLDENNHIELGFSYDNKTIFFVDSTKFVYNNFNASSGTLSFNFNTKDFYSITANKLGFNNFSISYTVYPYLRTTNLFGKATILSFGYGEVYSFDFVEEPIIKTENMSNQYFLSINNTNTQIAAPTVLYPNLILVPKIQIKTYNNYYFAPEINFYLKSSSTSTEKYYLSTISGVEKKIETNTSNIDNNSPVTITWDDLYFTIPKIEQQGYVISADIKVKYRFYGSYTIKELEGCPINNKSILQQGSPNIILENFEISENKTIGFTYSCTSFNLSNDNITQLNTKVYTKDPDDLTLSTDWLNLTENIDNFLTTGTNKKEGAITFTGTNPLSKLFYYIALELKTHQNITYYLASDTTKSNPLTYDSIASTILPYVLVYNTLPTISYRKNCLALNTPNFNPTETNEILLISRYANYSKIILRDDVENKEIIFDLSAGSIDGVTIDGGTWNSIT